MQKWVSRLRAIKPVADDGVEVPHDPAYPLPSGQGSVSDQARPLEARYIGNYAPRPRVHASGTTRMQTYSLVVPNSTMLERPSTSGGLSTTKAKQRQSSSAFGKFDKKVSRDDFYLDTRPNAGQGSARSDVRSKGPLLTPEASPSPKSQARPFIPVVREPTPEPIGEVEVATIGMAIGSPSHPPPGWGGWQPQQTLRPEPASHGNASPISAGGSVDSFDMPVVKKQSSKWKLFGRFRSKTETPKTAVSISQPNQLGGTVYAEPQEISPFVEEKEFRPSQGDTAAESKTPKHKPLVVRSQTMPDMESSAIGIASSMPRTLSSNIINSSTASGTLLDIEIPHTTMERYSVMFGGVLQNQSASSLLARRQATLDKLKSISDAVIKEEEEKQTTRTRAATSPQPSKSPAFVLFPPTRTTPTMSHQSIFVQPRPTALARSNTSPAVLSPSKASFDRSAHNRPKAASRVQGKPPTTLDVPDQSISMSQFPSRSSSRQHNFCPDESGLILSSTSEPEGDEEDDDEGGLPMEVIRSTSTRHHIPEPKWQMVTPQKMPSSASSVTSSRKRSPSSASSAQTHVTRPSIDLDEPDNIHMDPVEISIARQISLSRRQKRLLQPLQTSFAASSRNRAASSAAGISKTSPMVARIAAGENERLGETRGSTPTLVTPPPAVDNSPLAQHRKSARVVLEG